LYQNHEGFYRMLNQQKRCSKPVDSILRQNKSSGPTTHSILTLFRIRPDSEGEAMRYETDKCVVLLLEPPDKSGYIPKRIEVEQGPRSRSSQELQKNWKLFPSWIFTAISDTLPSVMQPLTIHKYPKLWMWGEVCFEQL
jgi:hypothetical protein